MHNHHCNRPITNLVYPVPVQGVVCTQHGGLNIRVSPNGAVMTTVPRGTSLTIMSPVQDGWVQVFHNGQSGWASAQFLCICDGQTGPEIPQPPIVIPPPPIVTPVPPIGIIPPPVVMPVPPIGVLPPVCQCPPPVTPVPPIGIVPPIFPPVTPVPPIGIVPPLPPANCGKMPTMACMATVQTQGSNLNMRETPSMDAQVVANLPNGSRILILGDEGDWWYVFAFNRFGYVSKQYVSVS